MGLRRVPGKAAVPQSDGVNSGSEGVGPKHHRGTVMDHYVGIDVGTEHHPRPRMVIANRRARRRRAGCSPARSGGAA
jgi:hypothetical protein